MRRNNQAKTLATQKRRARRRRRLQSLRSTQACRDEMVAATHRVHGRSTRRRQRSKEWMRRHSRLQRRKRRQAEALRLPLSRPRVTDSTSIQETTAGPTTLGGNHSGAWRSLYESTQDSQRSGNQDIQVQEPHWHTLDLGNVPTPSVRSATDGLLLKVPVRVYGHNLTALVDSGATRCYVARQAVVPLGMRPIHEDAVLELADGSKVHSDGRIPDVLMNMGPQVYKESFTVTDLLSDVDIVLGMSWLERVNPIIDWPTHTMYLRVQHALHPIRGLLVEKDVSTGTVKHLHACELSTDFVRSLQTLRTPQFWRMVPAELPWRKALERGSENADVADDTERIEGEVKKETDEGHQKNQKYICRTRMTPKGLVQQRCSKAARKREFISLKKCRKLTKQGETCYLAFIRFDEVVEQKTLCSVGMTQKQKRKQAKVEGPVKKFKTVEEVKQEVIQQADPKVKEALESIISDFQEVFPEKLPKGPPPDREVEHEIVTDLGAKPPSKPPYRLGPAEVEEMEEQVKDLLEQNFVRPSYSPYGAPVIFVPKKDGRWRMCIDYRMLNRQTKKDKYPIPRINELLDKLGRSKYFTKLDLASGYHQIAMKAEDIHKTAFRTSRGSYEFLVMPFGLTNAPATFQRLMNTVFKEELGLFVCVYLDDILVFSETLEDHIQHVRLALKRLRDAKLYGRLHKCEFFRQEVEYLGFDIGVHGVKASADKVKAVREWPKPNGVRDIRSFLGLASYYRRFIKDFSKIAHPLTDLTKEKIKFRWKDPEIAAFWKLKQALTSAPVLQLPDFEREFVLTTDASLVSVGCVLEQDFGHGLQPIAFESRKLGEAEMRYSAYERELLGMVWAIGKWRHYIEGRHFTIRTDHSSLRYLPNQPSVNRRIWKWVAILQGYDMEIVHIPGKINPADSFTRQDWKGDRHGAGRVKMADAALVEQLRVPKDASDQMIQDTVSKVITPNCTSKVEIPDFVPYHSLERDIDDSFDFMEPIQRVPALLVSESTIELDNDFKTELTQKLHEESPYDQIWQRLEDPDMPDVWDRPEGKFMIRGGLLKLHSVETTQEDQSQAPYWRIVVPGDMEVRRRILHELHAVPYSGHPGVQRTLELVRRQFWWRGMTSDTRDFVLSCPVCQVEKGSHQVPAGELVPLEIPLQKWDHIALDFVTHLPEDEGKTAILTVVDKATKMTHFIPCTHTITAKEMANLFWRDVGRLHGIPSVLISDRGDKFTSKFWKELWRLTGTSLRMGTAYHPQSSGQVERFNQVLSQTLRCTIHQLNDIKHWVALLPTIEFAVNSTPNRSTGYSGFFLNYGYNPVTPIQLLDKRSSSKVEAVTEFVSRMERTFRIARQNMQQASEAMKRDADRRRRNVVIPEGDMVLLNSKHLRFRGTPKKLKRRYVGPFKVLERIGETAYRLELPSQWRIHPVFHVSLVKSWRRRTFTLEEPATTPELEQREDPEERFEVDKLLRWRWRKVGRRREKEYLVLWSGYSIDDASWTPASNFTSQERLRELVEEDKPEEEPYLRSTNEE